ncbi:MAG: hypothetical protein WBD99_00060 [Thermodesulfobacteriota bacterium]
MGKPLVDLTTLNAVQSLFTRGQRDPWANQLAGAFADLFIYGDIVRYALPIPDEVAETLKGPSLLVELIRRDSDAFYPEEYSTTELRLLKDDYLTECFDNFAVWAKNNRYSLLRWIRLHKESWIRNVEPRIKHGYVFSLDRLRETPILSVLAREIGVSEDDICYAFDVVLRYPLYGELAGPSEHYLNHPIRDIITLPTMQHESASLPYLPVSFNKSIAGMASKLTEQDYTVLLHELRGWVHDSGMHKLGPGDFDKEVIRELASQVALPPRVKTITKALGIAAALIGGLGAFPVLGPSVAVAGAVVSISTLIWKGYLPRSAARVKWLRWAIKWDIEDQAEKRE